MGQPAAKQGDKVTATDTHIEVLSAGGTSSLPNPFSGTIDGGLSPDVFVESDAAAVVGSTATNSPEHVAQPGNAFQSPPSNQSTITQGSATVFINGKAAARDGDVARTCNDPTDLEIGKVVATSTVFVG